MTIEVRKPTAEENTIAESWSTWAKEVSEFDWNYGEKETCLILKGKAEVMSKDGETISFGAGDFVVFPVGLECTWKIIESIEKKYKFGD